MSRHKVVSRLVDLPVGVQDRYTQAWERMAATYAPDDPHVDQADPRWQHRMSVSLREVADAAGELQGRLPQRSLAWRLAFVAGIWANEKSTEYELRAQSQLD